ncbi:hypothetical protein ABG067_008579, partial [Albugo candida]
MMVMRNGEEVCKAKVNLEYNINAQSIFSTLPTFTGATFFGLEELHLIGQGFAKHVYELLTVSMGNKSNKCAALKYKSEDDDLTEEESMNEFDYTFDIPKEELNKIGRLIQKSRKTIP